jgi:hypothetical protein
MWRVIESTWANLSSYADLRPDFGLRLQINRSLQQTRPTLNGEEWFERFWRSRGIAQQVARFVYAHLTDYSGLCWGCTWPSDRLVGDLKLPLVCWFDWELHLCDDFDRELGVDLQEPPDLDQLVTVEDLVMALNARFKNLSSAC